MSVPVSVSVLGGRRHSERMDGVSEFSRFASTGYMLNLCARMLSNRMAEALAPLGVAPAQLPVLLTLSAIGQSTQRDLAVLGAIEQPTMALTLRRMERDGLIVREVDEEDRRRAIVRLTPHALDLVPRIEAIANAINERAMIGVDENEGAPFIDLVARVADNLRDVEGIRAAVAALGGSNAITTSA